MLRKMIQLGSLQFASVKHESRAVLRAIQSAVFFGAIMLASAGQVQAGVIAGFDIPQSGFGFTSIAPITGGSPNVTATSLFRTNNLIGFAFGNHFYFRNWDSTVNLSKYYSTTLTVDALNVLTLTNLTYSVEDTGVTPSSTFHVRSSLDNFMSDIDSFSVLGQGLVTNRTTDLSGLGPISDTIEFRFYATTANIDVSMGFANHLPGAQGGGLSDVGQNIRFNGSVAPAPVPEPASLAIFGIGACVAGFGAVRRRRSEKVQAPTV